MPIYDVMAPGRKNAVMNDTWGHMFPTPKTKHEGAILLSNGPWGGVTILDYHFPTLGAHGSPQEAEVIRTAMDLYDWPDTPAVWRVDCTLWFFKHSDDMWSEGRMPGRIIKPKITLIQDLAAELLRSRP